MLRNRPLEFFKKMLVTVSHIRHNTVFEYCFLCHPCSVEDGTGAAPSDGAVRRKVEPEPPKRGGYATLGKTLTRCSN